MTGNLPVLLIIDDDSDFCQLLISLMDNTLLQVEAVHTLGQAQLIIDQERPHVILLDQHLPDGLSIDFIPKIRSAGGKINIIMITADLNSLVAVDARERGVRHFISKPCSFKTITDLVYSTLP
ncbi:MAG TPA: response regulator [Chitinophagaceae bacterium]|nr:response regulator [Chitinophagaceae bacterium]